MAGFGNRCFGILEVALALTLGSTHAVSYHDCVMARKALKILMLDPFAGR